MISAGTVWVVLMVTAGVIAGGALAMAATNLKLYRVPPRARRDPDPAAGTTVSVCIPARNEEQNIGPCVRSLLAQDHRDLEVVVYNDDSTDATGSILEQLRRDDDRVRVAPSAALPEGWVGKQHACFRAAQAASGRWLLFTDADVRFAPDALRRSLHAAETLEADLVSTFPKQRTGSLAEALIVPMIHFVLFSYLPMARMRSSSSPAASAGCGQFLLISRRAYDASGGHESWKDSMHDGIRMPRAVRRAGYRTDLFDGTDLCSCRMYEGLAKTWAGFTKNAFEGLGSVGLLAFITVLHAVGHLLPPAYLIGVAAGWLPSEAVGPAALAVAFALAERVALALRFKQPWIGVVLHPLAIALMTAIQWHSYALHRAGKRSWRGRTARPASAPSGSAGGDAAGGNGPGAGPGRTSRERRSS